MRRCCRVLLAAAAVGMLCALFEAAAKSYCRDAHVVAININMMLIFHVIIIVKAVVNVVTNNDIVVITSSD